MSIFGPNFITSNLIKSIERDMPKYRELITPLHNTDYRITNPDLREFINEFGGHAGAMAFHIDELKKIEKMTSGSKIRRIIRIIFE